MANISHFRPLAETRVSSEKAVFRKRSKYAIFMVYSREERRFGFNRSGRFSRLFVRSEIIGGVRKEDTALNRTIRPHRPFITRTRDRKSLEGNEYCKVDT